MEQNCKANENYTLKDCLNAVNRHRKAVVWSQAERIGAVKLAELVFCHVDFDRL